MTEQNQSQNFLYSIGDFIKAVVVAVWMGVTTIFSAIWQIVLKVLDFVAQLLNIVAKFIRSIFLGVAAIIVAIGILVFAIGGAFYLIGSALGLDKSKNLETTRELLLKAPTKWIEGSFEEDSEKTVSNDSVIEMKEIDLIDEPIIEIPEVLPEVVEPEGDLSTDTDLE